MTINNKKLCAPSVRVHMSDIMSSVQVAVMIGDANKIVIGIRIQHL